MIRVMHRIMCCFPFTAAGAACLFAAGCTVGPKYHRPAVDTPAAYKELAPSDYPSTDGWKVAQPNDAALRGKWWEIFNNPELNALEEKVNVSNQTIASAAASFFAARAMVKEARAQLFPTVTVNPSVTLQRSPSRSTSGGTVVVSNPGSGTGTGSSTAATATTFADYS